MPTDNPFYDGAGPHWDSVWAYGLRNPFRAYFDAPTGPALHRRCRRQRRPPERGAERRRPRRQLRLAGLRGTVLRALHEPALRLRAQRQQTPPSRAGSSITAPSSRARCKGNYFFADYAQHWIKRMTFDANGNVTGVFNFEPLSGNPNESAGDVVYLTEGPDGALYYVDLGYSDITGTFGVSKIRRIRYLAVQPGAGRARLGQPDLGTPPARRDVLERGIERPRGTADHVLVGLRRRHLVDRGQPGPHLRRTPASTSCG